MTQIFSSFFAFNFLDKLITTMCHCHKFSWHLLSWKGCLDVGIAQHVKVAWTVGAASSSVAGETQPDEGRRRTRPSGRSRAGHRQASKAEPPRQRHGSSRRARAHHQVSYIQGAINGPDGEIA